MGIKVRSRRYVVGVGFAIAAAVLGIMFIRGHFLNGTHWALEVNDIDLGGLGPGEKRTFEVALRNRSAAPIRLIEPKSDCGCLITEDAGVIVPPRESVILEATLTAPSSPQSVVRRIAFESEGSSKQVWTVRIEGVVDPIIWASPPSVILERSDSNTRLSRTLSISHKPDVVISDVVAEDTASLQLNLPTPGTQSRSVSISLLSALPEGASVVRVLDGKGKTLLAIPVEWRVKPPFVCVPKAISLKPVNGTSPAIVKRNVMVWCTSEDVARRLGVDAIRPLAKVVDRNVQGSTVNIALSVDMTKVSVSKTDSAVRISDPISGESLEVPVVVH